MSSLNLSNNDPIQFRIITDYICFIKRVKEKVR